MPRQRTHHSRRTYVFPDDFPERLVRFKEESDLPWAEIARRLGTYPHTVKRWWKEGVRPHFRHQMALLDVADDLGLGHLFTDWSIRRETGNGTPGSAGGERSSARVLRPAAPPRCKSPKRKAAHRRGGRDRMQTRRRFGVHVKVDFGNVVYVLWILHRQYDYVSSMS